MSEQHIRNIREQGWTEAIFITPEGDRAEYARLANTIISIALEDDDIRDSLSYELNPQFEPGTVRAGLFGIGRARNSADEKVYLHTGFYSREYADILISERNQPKDMRHFWKANEGMLHEVEVSTMSLLRKLGAERLQASVFPPKYERRNVHLRTVRYPGALEQPVGTEVVSGHADLGLATFHLYETHGGWFYAAPYAAKWITSSDSPERREAVREMREQLEPIDQSHDGYAPFFLGANWQTFPHIPNELKDLPACYHAGFRPDPLAEIISPYARQVVQDSTERVSVISFIHPNGDMLRSGAYQPATVSNCRPEYKDEE